MKTTKRTNRSARTSTPAIAGSTVEDLEAEGLRGRDNAFAGVNAAMYDAIIDSIGERVAEAHDLVPNDDETLGMASLTELRAKLLEAAALTWALHEVAETVR